MQQEPKTLVEAIRHFADPDVSLKTMVQLRWPDGVTCPSCGNKNPRFLANQRRWECPNKHPRRQFSAKTGTVFEDSPLGLDKWFTAVWLIANCKNGVSSLELHRAIGVTQKSAWFMLHRIRLAMQNGTIEKSSGDGEAEADETYVGGKSKNMHKAARKRKIPGSGVAGKAVVMGILSRGAGTNPSRIVVAKHLPDATKARLQAEVRSAVEAGTKIYTDAHAGYHGLAQDYVHEVVDHAVEYVREKVHTNGMENFWSLLKRAIKGTYVSVTPPHLGRYIDEQVFRFNERDKDDGKRFREVVSSVTGKRLTYDELTGHSAEGAT
jgi:transposase-like protein